MEKQYKPKHVGDEKQNQQEMSRKQPASAVKDSKVEEKKKEEVKTEIKMENQTDNKVEEKKEVKNETKKEVKPIVKKEEAIASGSALHASKKHCMYISNFIKNKSIDKAIADLESVLLFKQAIPFKGEIPHRKGMHSGRYPIKVSAMFITMLKGLRGNCIVNGLDLDKTRIYYASASWASRPAKRGGARFKRTNVILKAKEIKMKEEKKGEKK